MRKRMSLSLASDVKVKGLILALSIAGLAACGGTGQDDGRVNNNFATVNGAALDGPIAGSVVFLDLNGDGKQNSFEPFARTDTQGYFSTSADGTTDYCADTATASQQRFCLRSTSSGDDVKVCSIDGYDIVTLTPFDGTLCRRVSVTAGASVTAVISPLSTLVDSVSSANRATILSALDLSEEDLNVDYINDLATNPDAVSIFKKAVKLVKVASVLQDRIQDRYDEVGEEDELPSNILEDVLMGLAEVITEEAASTGTVPTIDSILSSTTHLASVLSKAEDSVVNLYNGAEIALPARISNSQDGTQLATDTTDLNNAVNVATDLAGIAERAINTTTIAGAGDAAAILLAATGAVNAVEVVLQKSNGEGANASETDIQTEIDNILADPAFIDALVNTLSANNIDLGVLIDNDLSATDEGSAVLTSVALDGNAQTFTNLDGKGLLVNDPDNNIPSKRKHGRLGLFFQADAADSVEGDLSACIRYIDGNGFDDPNGVFTPDDSDLEDGDTRGALATGTWERLDTGGYAVMVSLKVSDASEPSRAIFKSAGENGDSQHVFRIDFDGGIDRWTSVNGLIDQAADFVIPASDTECRRYFNDNPQ